MQRYEKDGINYPQTDYFYHGSTKGRQHKSKYAKTISPCISSFHLNQGVITSLVAVAEGRVDFDRLSLHFSRFQTMYKKNFFKGQPLLQEGLQFYGLY